MKFEYVKIHTNQLKPVLREWNSFLNIILGKNV